MTDIASLRTDAEKARLEMNALKNGAARGVYALDKVLAGVAALEAAPPVVVPPVEDKSRPWDIAVFPKLTFSQLEVEPGAAFAHIKLTLDRDPFMTVRVKIQAAGDQATGFYAGDFKTAQPYVVTFSPGDDLTAYLSIPIKNRASKDGWKFRLLVSGTLRQSGWSEWEKGTHLDVYVRAAPKEPNVLPANVPKQRPMQRLTLGTPSWDVAPDKWEWSRTGEGGKWRTALQYGDGPANQPTEKGLYANAITYPGSDPHLKETDAQGRPYVRLHTRRFPAPVAELDMSGRATGKYLGFQASWLSAQNIDALCAETGLWEFECVSPSRRYAWAAFWMMGVKNRQTVWPPEIDVFEHFNGVYGSWDTKVETSSTLHYGDFGVGRAGAKGATINLPHLGKPVDLTTQIHKHQCLVTEDFITIFFDGEEIVQFRHILKPVKATDTKLFHPIINVAVAPSDANDAYDQGSGDMLAYGFRYFPPDQVSAA